MDPREPNDNAEEKWAQRLSWAEEKRMEEEESSLTPEDIYNILSDEKYDDGR